MLPSEVSETPLDMDVSPKKGAPNVNTSSHGSHDVPPNDAQFVTETSEDDTDPTRPCKKHASAPLEEPAFVGAVATDRGLPLVTFLDTQPWLRTSSCSGGKLRVTKLSTTAREPAEHLDVETHHSCCLACGHSAPSFASRPCDKEIDVLPGKRDHQENIREPGVISFFTVTAPKSPLVFAYDATVSLQLPSSTPNFSPEPGTFTSFPAVLAVDGTDFRLAVGPQSGAGNNKREGELKNSGAHAEREPLKGDEMDGVANMPEGWDDTLWGHCFTFTCDIVKIPPRVIVNGALTSLELTLPLLTLVFHVTRGSASGVARRMSALVTGMSGPKSSYFGVNRDGDGVGVAERLSDKGSKPEDRGHDDATAKRGASNVVSNVGLSNVFEEFIQKGISLVMPPDSMDTAVYGSSTLLTRFAKSAAVTDRALTHAVQRAADWTSFALHQPSSESAGGVMSAEQFQKRRKTFRALYPPK